MHRKYLVAMVPILLVVLLGGIIVYAVAQGGGFQGGGAQPGGGRGGPGGNNMMRMMMGRMGTPAIAVAGDAVFVVQAGNIYKFDAGTLELLAQAEIPRPEMPEMPGGGAAAPAGPGR